MRKSLFQIALVSCATLLAGACNGPFSRNRDLDALLPPGHRIPNEEFKTTLPPYVIEPPDVLLIDALKVIPKVPYLLEPLDIIQIVAENVFPDYPIAGNYQIEADGSVDLGPQYGSVQITEMTDEQAEAAIQKKLEEELREPVVSVILVQTIGQQQISGQHLVTPQGNVNMGTYGEVYVAGMTLVEAKAAIEKHLEQHLESPEVLVDIFSYNSKVYYIITDGGGTGDRVARVPVQGGETVLDAISQLGGLTGISTTDIWIARPAPDDSHIEQRLPIDWEAITRRGVTSTNYQILPNDRLFIRAYRSTMFDSTMARITQPIERVSGFILLGSGAIRNLNQSFSRGSNFGNQQGF